MIFRPNATITKITKPGNMDKYGDLSYATRVVDIPCRLIDKSKVIISQDGEKITVDGTVECPPNVDIAARDQIEMSFPRYPTYTVISVDDTVSVTGKIDRKVANVVKKQR